MEMRAFLTEHVYRNSPAKSEQKKAEELLSRLYEHFFNYGGYRAMTLERSKPSILHAAIYRKDASEYLRNFAQFVRVGMQKRLNHIEE